MALFFVNGAAVTPSGNQTLLRYLRDELRLTSVKDGCSEGACGTCTVLIDGKPTRACIPKTDTLEGKRIVTVEGLSDFERRAYTYAFSVAGAVQCGFCIPGMVLCTKALLAENANPTEAEAAYAIRNNYCRCSGYVKIIRAMLLAAELFRAGTVPELPQDASFGARAPRIDAPEKILGTGRYPDDVYLPNMLHIVAVRSRYPRARVLSIDPSGALAMPGVVRVLTAADIPGENKVGHLVKDWDTMIAVGEVTHYLGDVICLIAAETRKQAEDAKAGVAVSYEVLPAVHNPQEAMAEGAPLVHRGGNLMAHKHIARGDADGAIRDAKYVVHDVFHTPWTEHAFLEPECAVAYPEGDGVHILSADQSAYDTQHETAPMLGLPMEKVRVENLLVGGGFGGKEDVTVQHLAALCAYLTGRPCKMKLSRAESILVHPKRHPMDIDFTLACDDFGNITGVKVKIIADTGAYASLGGPVLERACTHASGPYCFHNFEIDGYAYYTNNPPAGAFRGFGVTQTCFCMESLLSQMADKVGITPWEIRFRNAIRPGDELPNGQIVDASTGLVETLIAVKPAYDRAKYVGIACAMKNAGVGVGLPDTGRVRLRVSRGKVVIYTGASCIGQGLGTVLLQIVCTQLSLPRSAVVYVASNTFEAPDSGTTSGSRQTTITGEACRRACEQVRAELEAGRTLEDLEGRAFYAEYLAKTDPLGADVKNPVSHVTYGYATQVCILADDGKIERIIAAHDVGQAVNPLSCEGQIEGGVAMSMGFALREQYPIDENCRPTARFGTLGLFRAHEMPKIEAILVEKKGLNISGGAIGLGEITAIPTAPAIADAYFRYDGKFRTSLPLSDTPYARKK